MRAENMIVPHTRSDNTTPANYKYPLLYSTRTVYRVSVTSGRVGICWYLSGDTLHPVVLHMSITTQQNM
jgi:hypothetical protein